MIKLLLVEFGALPTSGVVALQAIRTEAAFVLVLVTGRTGLAESHPRVVQVFALQDGTSVRADVLRGVATLALSERMLAVKHVSGLGMIEPVWRGLPMQHVEVFTIMVRMALYAGPRLRKYEVKSASILNLRGNLFVAFGAAKSGRSSGDRVTLRAIGGPVQALMGAGQRSRRNLRFEDSRGSKQRGPEQDEAEQIIQERSVSNSSSLHLCLACLVGFEVQSRR